MTDPTKFTASNGYVIEHPRPARTVIRDNEGENTLVGHNFLDDQDVRALREFFVTEEYARLGVSVHPDYPRFLFQRSRGNDDADGRAVIVLDLDGNDTYTVWERHRRGDGGAYIVAGHAWLDANPDPAGWVSAKPGEVWSVSTAHRTNEVAWRLESGAFMFVDEGFAFAADITAGERVWPPVADA